jgi:hypothetical protein
VVGVTVIDEPDHCVRGFLILTRREGKLLRTTLKTMHLLAGMDDVNVLFRTVAQMIKHLTTTPLIGNNKQTS